MHSSALSARQIATSMIKVVAYEECLRNRLPLRSNTNPIGVGRSGHSTCAARRERLDAISDFALFRAMGDAGGISAAALVLQSSPAAVSRRLTALEAKLGGRLADRSSRRFRLTDEGLLLYERSRSILQQVRDAETEVASRGGGARGLLKVGAPSDFGRRHV